MMGGMVGWRALVFVGMAGWGAGAGWCDTPAANGPVALPGTRAAVRFRAVDDAALPNARWVTDGVLCGGKPEAEAGFAKLQLLGIKTVISVDGIRPDVEL